MTVVVTVSFHFLCLILPDCRGPLTKVGKVVKANYRDSLLKTLILCYHI